MTGCYNLCYNVLVPFSAPLERGKEALNLLGEEFAIEIINGANQVFDCFDITDEMAIKLWDKHLCRGKKVSLI